MKKTILISVLLILVFCTAVSAFAADFKNGEMTLSIPDDLAELLIIDVPENDESGLLFSVAEKKSVEIAKKQGNTWEGAGWLFSISVTDEKSFHELLCYDMFGTSVFAVDQQGGYYLYNHPTDVRMVREDYSDPKNFEDWNMLSEWSRTVPDTFIADNAGLTPEHHGNTELDILLARALYMEGTKYSVSTTEFGPLEADGFADSKVYLKQLSENVTFSYLPEGNAPDGEYVVLSFPEEDFRFDFFTMTGYENIIRQVWFNGQNEMLYEAVYDDENTRATDVMLRFYDALAKDAGLSVPGADSIAGTYADNVAGRCAIEFTAADEPGKYNVEIRWGSSAFETVFWTMTAAADGDDPSILRYEDAVQTIVTFTSETEKTETVVYENGTGMFTFQGEDEFRWVDETGHAADDLLYRKVK